MHEQPMILFLSIVNATSSFSSDSSYDVDNCVLKQSCFVFTSVTFVCLQIFKGRDLIDLTKSFIIQGLGNTTVNCVN